jgi:hypothetical protein
MATTGGRARGAGGSTRHKSRAALWRFWRRAVAEGAASGLAPRHYCAQAGLAPSSYFRWRHRFQVESADAETTPEGRPLFLPLRLGAPSDAVASGLAVGGGTDVRMEPLEVLLGGGRSVLVRGDFEARVLAKVVAVLEVQRC